MGFSTVGGITAHESTHRSGGSDAIAGALALGAIPSPLTGKQVDTLADGAVSTMAKIAAGIKNAASGLPVLDASTLITLAQIPATLTGKDADSVDGVSLPGTIANVLSQATLQKIVDTTVSGTQVTSIDISGLDLDASKMFLIYMKIGNAYGDNITIRMYLNNDTEATNYLTEYVRGSASTASAASASNAIICSPIFAGDSGIFQIFMMRDQNGKAKSFISGNVYTTAGVVVENYSYYYIVAGNITRITFTASVADSIDVGSQVIIFQVSS